MPSGMASRAKDRQFPRTAQEAQTAFAASACRAAGPVTAPTGKNNSGSARTQAPLDIQLRERVPDLTDSIASRPPDPAGGSADLEGNHAPTDDPGRN